MCLSTSAGILQIPDNGKPVKKKKKVSESK